LLQLAAAFFPGKITSPGMHSGCLAAETYLLPLPYTWDISSLDWAITERPQDLAAHVKYAGVGAVLAFHRR
jgi:hypothetical protein